MRFSVLALKFIKDIIIEINCHSYLVNHNLIIFIYDLSNYHQTITKNRNKSFMEIRQQETLCKDNVQKTLDFLYKKLILIASQHLKCFQR